jgi:adenylosuccinate synthase
MVKQELITKLIREFVEGLEESLGVQIQNLSYSKEQDQVIIKQNEGDLKE